MATLVLTSLGAVLGPVGAAIGATLGQLVDRRIFGPRGASGPRLQDLRIQTSSYGAPIPQLFGTVRVAGTLIWSTDLIETRNRQGGGKGRPSTTSYSYSASFAVLLSGRRVGAVRRIWADGNLLRGAGGDWKGEIGGFRLHDGRADQPPDPLIAALEPAAPAYRGRAYAVFEQLQLAPFGNRIPALTFEVEADPGPVMLDDVLAELGGGAVVGQGGDAVSGLVVAADTLGQAVETFADLLPAMPVPAGRGLRIGAAGPPVTLGPDEIGIEDRQTRSSAAGPTALSLGYFDPARDYQAGVQRARRPGAGESQARIDLPVTLDAGAARQLAERAIDRRRTGMRQRTLRCGWRRLTLAPGDLVQTPDEARIWRVTERRIGRDGVMLSLVAIAHGLTADLPAAPGRPALPPDAVHGPTRVHLLDLPPLDDAPVARPRLLVAAAGAMPGWRRAALLIGRAATAELQPIGDTVAPALIGTALAALPPADPGLFDLRHSVDVAMAHAGMMLADADDGRLIAGANLALIGDELVQYGMARPLGEGRWRLSRLVRGRRGTGAAVAGHRAGERFLLIEPDALRVHEPPVDAIGADMVVLASGIGDPQPVESVARGIGAAVRPLPPVHLAARRRADGGFDLSWIRQSREGGRWIDGTDAPLGEEREAYRLEIVTESGPARSWLSDRAFHVYGPDDVARDRLAGVSVTMRVVQLGSFAASQPAQLRIALGA
ncbi:hypothetical protein GVO57_07270 [Sphingomonas changnyeongensis]|uniref:Tip attachment protein J domain-containing protein n=1 Tax=Sphingomonas changnyeongensis TaxID=2698679 RepID=A0A7Z2NVV6_9SPHN|nr:phage tail protein [Sphingomonas changnyeongensis]QHL90667.1 hypothetical protein GVO57_07270 [Sphingomonas changnyeongensis]